MFIQLVLLLSVFVNIYYVLLYLPFIFIAISCVVRQCFISAVSIRFFGLAVVVHVVVLRNKV
jgi:hypothetical protein